MAEENKPLDEIQSSAKKMQKVMTDFQKESEVNPANIVYRLQKDLITEDKDGNPIYNKDADIKKAIDSSITPFRKHLFKLMGWGDATEEWATKKDPRTGTSVIDLIDDYFGVPKKDVVKLIQGFATKGYDFVLTEAGEAALQPINNYIGKQAQLTTQNVMAKIQTDKEYQAAAQMFIKNVLGDKIKGSEKIIGPQLEDLVQAAMGKYSQN